MPLTHRAYIKDKVTHRLRSLKVLRAGSRRDRSAEFKVRINLPGSLPLQCVNLFKGI